MLTFTTIGPGSRTGEYLAGYFSPSAPTTFTPLVSGCPTEAIARSEAARLQRAAHDAEQRAVRYSRSFSDRLLRTPQDNQSVSPRS